MAALLFFLIICVFIALLGFSVTSMALVLERSVFWARVLPRQERLVQYVFSLFSASTSYVEVRERSLSYLQKHMDLPMARLFVAAIVLDRPTLAEFRLALETAAIAELPAFKKFQSAFDTIVTVSPLLGLLGTVLGLMRSLGSLKLGEAGGNTAGVTGGISEALSTTAAGLLVAIFTLLFANLFRSLYQRQRSLVQQYGGQLELLYGRQVLR